MILLLILFYVLLHNILFTGQIPDPDCSFYDFLPVLFTRILIVRSMLEWYNT